MRLIDGDELLEKMYRYTDNEGAKMPYGDDDSLIHKDSACFLIENAPTIEPERKKGTWDYTDDMYETYKCSECGFNTDDYIEYNFCPNCGADMREGEEKLNED